MPNTSISPNSPNPPIPSVLRKQVNWENLHFFQKSDVLYQLAATFCERFLPAFGDRTVDQMIQAARSGKQNIESITPLRSMHRISTNGLARKWPIRAIRSAGWWIG